jgi:hypothetical protein
MPKGVKRPAPTWGFPSISTTETEKISISTLRPRLNWGIFYGRRSLQSANGCCLKGRQLMRPKWKSPGAPAGALGDLNGGPLRELAH